MTTLTEAERAALDDGLLDRKGAITITSSKGDSERYVPAAVFLKEFERAAELNRAVHLIASTIFTDYGMSHPVSRRLLAVGVTFESAMAVKDLVRQVMAADRPGDPGSAG